MTWCRAVRRRHRSSEDAVRAAEVQRDMARHMRRVLQALSAESADLHRRNGFGEAVYQAMGRPPGR